MSSNRKNIPEPVVKQDLQIKFSFEFYDTDNDDYCLSKFTNEQIKLAMHRLKDISSKTFNELMQQKKILHFGQVYWDRTIKPEGFGQLNLEVLEPFHFALLGVNGQLARVYGAYGSGTFYIVWFDLHHLIWPTPLKNT